MTVASAHGAHARFLEAVLEAWVVGMKVGEMERLPGCWELSDRQGVGETIDSLDGWWVGWVGGWVCCSSDVVR